MGSIFSFLRGYSIHKAVEAGSLKLVKGLIEKNPAIIRERDSDGWTPLHWACRSHKAEMVELLLAHGADVNARDAKGRTPRSIALQDGQEEVVKILQKYGAAE